MIQRFNVINRKRYHYHTRIWRAEGEKTTYLRKKHLYLLEMFDKREVKGLQKKFK